MADENGGQGGGLWESIAGGLINGAATVAGNVFSGKSGLKRQYKYWKKMSDYQQNINRANAQWAFDMESAYNSPDAQMARYKEAGLNPNLIYGQGSPGNTSVSTPAGPSLANLDTSYGDYGTDFMRGRMMAAQTDLTQTKVAESNVKQDLNIAQQKLVLANPYLNARYVDAMVKQLESTATLKAQESSFMTSTQSDTETAKGSQSRWERGFLKMQRELDLMGKKYDLAQKDDKVKAEIIESKEFENSLKEIQLRFMKDGDITPQHILEFAKLLLTGLTR